MKIFETSKYIIKRHFFKNRQYLNEGVEGLQKLDPELVKLLKKNPKLQQGHVILSALLGQDDNGYIRPNSIIFKNSYYYTIIIKYDKTELLGNLRISNHNCSPKQWYDQLMLKPNKSAFFGLSGKKQPFFFGLSIVINSQDKGGNGCEETNFDWYIDEIYDKCLDASKIAKISKKLMGFVNGTKKYTMNKNIGFGEFATRYAKDITSLIQVKQDTNTQSNQKVGTNRTSASRLANIIDTFIKENEGMHVLVQGDASTRNENGICSVQFDNKVINNSENTIKFIDNQKNQPFSIPKLNYLRERFGLNRYPVIYLLNNRKSRIPIKLIPKKINQVSGSIQAVNTTLFYKQDIDKTDPFYMLLNYANVEEEPTDMSLLKINEGTSNKINKKINTMKKIIRLTENDLHKIIRNSVKRILKEDAYDHFFGSLEDKKYPDTEEGELERYLDDRDAMNDYQKYLDMTYGYDDHKLSNRVGVRPDVDYQNSYSNGNRSQTKNSFATIGTSNDDEPFHDGELSMMAQSDDPQEQWFGRHKDWASKKY